MTKQEFTSLEVTDHEAEAKLRIEWKRREDLLYELARYGKGGKNGRFNIEPTRLPDDGSKWSLKVAEQMELAGDDKEVSLPGEER